MAFAWLPPPDGSRDHRIDDPTNVWLVHPAGRALLPLALRLGISANSVSVVGLFCGAAAAWAYWQWPDSGMATLGLALSFVWLVADGLDGMIARATKTASPLGRILDGLCDHGVFGLLYVAIAFSIGTTEAWVVGWLAAIVHAFQANLGEAERTRYHRRVRGDPGLQSKPQPKNPFIRIYDAVAGSLDRLAQPFDQAMRTSPDPARLSEAYGNQAAPALKLLSLLSANSRVIILYLACMVGRPMLFWWFELIVLSLVTIVGIVWHRRIELWLVNTKPS